MFIVYLGCEYDNVTTAALNDSNATIVGDDNETGGIVLGAVIACVVIFGILFW